MCIQLCTYACVHTCIKYVYLCEYARRGVVYVHARCPYVTVYIAYGRGACVCVLAHVRPLTFMSYPLTVMS